jgi:guanylate kinase
MKNIIKTKGRGNLIVISGPSGAGKGTVIDKLRKVNDNFWLSISMTSREVRSNDVPNETYFFVSKEEFERRIEEGVFLEYAMYNNNYYGTPKDKILEKLNQGVDVILEIEI